MKVCIRCKEEKSLDDFRKNSKSKDNLDKVCKQCRSATEQRYRQNNPERYKKRKNKFYVEHKRDILLGQKNYKEANPEKVRESKKKEYLKNRDRYKKSGAEYRNRNRDAIRTQKSEYAKNNKEKVNAANGKHRAVKRNARVCWANEKYVKLWYLQAKLEEERTGKKCHVDHIVPLKSNLVCGLHNEFNLQVLYAEDNVRKYNREWPNMP